MYSIIEHCGQKHEFPNKNKNKPYCAYVEKGHGTGVSSGRVDDRKSKR